METLKRAFRFQTINLKGEKYFENIHENYVPNVKDHVLSTFVTKEAISESISHLQFMDDTIFEEASTHDTKTS